MVRSNEHNITEVELSLEISRIRSLYNKAFQGSFVVRIAIHKYHDFPALIHIQLQLEQTNNICFFLAIFFLTLLQKGAEAQVFPVLTWKNICRTSKQDGAFLSLCGRGWVHFQPCRTAGSD